MLHLKYQKMQQTLLLITILLLQSTLLFADVSGKVFNDFNNDGFYNYNDTPLSGKVVNLYLGNTNTLIVSTSTDSNGYYEFTNLEYNLYTITISYLPNACNTKSYIDLNYGFMYTLDFPSSCINTGCCAGSHFEFVQDHVQPNFGTGDCSGDIVIAPSGISPCHQIILNWQGNSVGTFTSDQFPVQFSSGLLQNETGSLKMTVEELDGYGNSCFTETICEDIIIPPCNGTCTDCNIEPSFTFNSNNNNPMNIQFMDETLIDTDCTITNWSWTFGDGTSSTSQNPQHSYQNSGSFIVCMTIHFDAPNQSTCPEFYCETIEVEPTWEDCDNFIDLSNSILESTTIRASQQLFSSGTIAQNEHVAFRAEDRVRLTSGFSTESGSTLSVSNEACTNCIDDSGFFEQIPINPLFARVSPIAKNVSIEILDPPTDCDENIRLEASFEEGVIGDEFLAVLVNDEKCVLRDDGKGADKVAEDNIFSIFIEEDLSRLDNILNQADLSTIDLGDPSTVFNIESTILDRGTIVSNAPDNPAPPQPINVDIFESEDDIDVILSGNQTFDITVEQLLLGRPPIDFDAEKTLMIIDTDVVEDQTRTFNPCTQTGNPDGVWTFGNLMRELAGGAGVSDVDVSNFVMNWLETWNSNQVVNGESLPARNAIQNLIIDPWLVASGSSTLDMKFAPFKLTAIVNRLDLRGNTGFTDENGEIENAGEGRFVFCAVNLENNCSPFEFNVIFEYGIPKKTCGDLQAYADDWSALNDEVLGSSNYNILLENITNQFMLSGNNPSKPNQNALNQLRTNEVALAGPWELREFVLNNTGQLELHPVAMEPAVKYNTKANNSDVAILVDFINNHVPAIFNNQYEVPLEHNGNAFLGGKAHTPFPPAGPVDVASNTPHHWDGAPSGSAISNDFDRHVFSLNTCSGCHGGETQTFFTHVDPTPFGSEAGLSGFLTGEAGRGGPEDADGDANNNLMTVNDPSGAPFLIQYNDLRRRSIDLDFFLATELTHKLTIRPLNMVH